MGANTDRVLLVAYTHKTPVRCSNTISVDKGVRFNDDTLNKRVY